MYLEQEKKKMNEVQSNKKHFTHNISQTKDNNDNYRAVHLSKI
jgi:hypothetical protein